jgi:hypothetical protein
VVLVAAQLDLITGTIDKLLGGTNMMIPRVILLLTMVIVEQLQMSKLMYQLLQVILGEPLCFRWCWWQPSLTSQLEPLKKYWVVLT